MAKKRKKQWTKPSDAIVQGKHRWRVVLRLCNPAYAVETCGDHKASELDEVTIRRNPHHISL